MKYKLKIFWYTVKCKIGQFFNFIWRRESINPGLCFALSIIQGFMDHRYDLAFLWIYIGIQWAIVDVYRKESEYHNKALIEIYQEYRNIMKKVIEMPDVPTGK